jgi:hypothetical protein
MGKMEMEESGNKTERRISGSLRRIKLQEATSWFVCDTRY